MYASLKLKSIILYYETEHIYINNAATGFAPFISNVLSLCVII